MNVSVLDSIPPRYCSVCGVRMSRARPNGNAESPAEYARRTKCHLCRDRQPKPYVDRTPLTHPGRLCFGVDTDELFPREDERNAADRIGPLARALCTGCPVLRECREIGERAKERGLWGGVLRTDGGRVVDLLAQKEGAA